MKVPAPIGGLNYRDSDNRLDQRDAKLLDNWIPDNGYCVIREGGAGPGNGPDAPLGGGSGGSGSSGGGDGNGDDTPIDVGIPIYPECQPYSCSALMDWAESKGYEAVDFSSIQGDSPVVPEYFDLYGTGLDSTIRPQSDKVGDVLGTTYYTNQYYLYAIQEGDADVCDGTRYALALGENTSASAQGPKIYLESKQPGAGMRIIGGISHSSNGSGLFSRALYFTVTYSNAVVENKQINLGINWKDGQGFEVGNNTGGTFFGLPTFNSGENLLYVYAEMQNIRVVDDYIDGYWTVVGDYVLQAQVNGSLYEYNGVVQMSQLDAGGQPVVSNISYGSSRMFSGMQTRLLQIVGIDEGVDLDALYNAYQRNSSDYEPPEFCNA